jgi:hypothetical protein
MRAIATALPMPVPAPVTMAVLLALMRSSRNDRGIADAAAAGKPLADRRTKRAVIGDRPLI